VNELGFLAVLEGAVHHQTLSNGSITEGLIDLTGEEFQEQSLSIARAVNLAELSYRKSHSFKEVKRLLVALST
jgi:hypothetical protein